MLPRIYHTAMGTGPASPYLQTRYRMSNVRQPHRVLFIFLFLFLFLFWRAARFQKRAHLRLGFGNLARVWFVFALVFRRGRVQRVSLAGVRESG